MSEPVLCYVRGCWAFFTTQPLESQSGDGWHKRPYEHNADEPYAYHPDSDGVGCVCLDPNSGRRLYGPKGCGEPGHVPERPKEPWEIVKVAWEGPFETPAAWHLNSPYSVEGINRGDVAWLRPGISAGTTLAEFRRLVWLAGGRVYECPAAGDGPPGAEPGMELRG